MSFDYPRKVQFKCAKCGICCGDTKERTRHILLLIEEANDIASTTSQPISDFASRIEDKPPYHYEMKKTVKDGKCVFLRQNRCTIYSIRPLICRFYPFGLKTTEKEQRIFYYTKECPGIGKGKPMGEEDFHKLLRQASKRTKMKRGKGEVET
jgi:Fe-S-cluster containining protein